MWKTIKSKILIKNQYLTLKGDEVELPNGKRDIHYLMERCDFALVIAKNKDKFFLIQQYRNAVKSTSLEFVEGGIEKGEKPVMAARRELREEIGLVGDSFTEIGYHWLADGYSSQGYYVFVAENCMAKAETKLDDMEYGLTMKELTLSQIQGKIKTGEIKDAPTIAAWAMYMLNYDKR